MRNGPQSTRFSFLLEGCLRSLTCRPQDVFGIGGGTNRFSDDFVRALRAIGQNVSRQSKSGDTMPISNVLCVDISPPQF